MYIVKKLFFRFLIYLITVIKSKYNSNYSLIKKLPRCKLILLTFISHLKKRENQNWAFAFLIKLLAF